MAGSVEASIGDAQKPLTPADDDGRQRVRQQIYPWNKAKLILRLFLIAASVAATIISLASIPAPRLDGYWILISPVYALPYTVLSFAWEAIELVILLVRRSKSRGVQPPAHLACELLLWMSGVSISIVWIVLTAQFQQMYTFYEDVLSGGIRHKWLAVNYAWCGIVMWMAICQFIIFAFSCVEVDRNRRNLERQVNHILQLIEDRGQKPEDVLAALAPPEDYNSMKPTWPVEMPAMNPDPVELCAEESPSEMVGDLGGRESPARRALGAEDASGNQKYRFGRKGPSMEN